MIAGNIPSLSITDIPFGMRKMIPDGFRLAIFIPSPLDLIRGRACSPQKVLGEAHFPIAHFCH